MKINLQNKTALICASSYGIGFSCAKILATTGANIILTSRSASNIKKAEELIKKTIKSLNYNNKVFSYKVDFSNKSSTNKFARKIKKIHKIDILILNTGGPTPGNFCAFKKVSIDFRPERHYQFRLLSVVLGRTIRSLVSEAIEFVHRNLMP